MKQFNDLAKGVDSKTCNKNNGDKNNAGKCRFFGKQNGTGYDTHDGI